MLRIFPRAQFVFLLSLTLLFPQWVAPATGAEPKEKEKIRIYQFLPRLFGNTNETRKPNGDLQTNGCGKFADFSDEVLAELKAMGFTHLWPTGILQQATATDYRSIGEPADDPDLLKGIAGSPYAIRDYFDVSPDYAVDPGRRLEEWQEFLRRAHQAGLKVIIDFVPNHVARSYASTIRPELSFGAGDDRTKFFHPQNNFFWLTPESGAEGGGPPLRLPTVDETGRPTSPTVQALGQGDGRFDPETEHGRVTGNNLISWAPDAGSWYETVKLNYGYDFTGRAQPSRMFPHPGAPDLPLPNTWKKMDEILAYWQAMGVDGFRVDMAHLVPPEFWAWAIGRARERSPGVFFVAEAYEDDPAKVPPIDPTIVAASEGRVMGALLAAGFDAVYDDATYDKLKDIYEKGAWANDLDHIGLPEKVFIHSLRYAENHDEVRLAAPSEWQGIGMEVGRPVSALLFGLSRGPVMLYHGQEVGEPALGAEGFGGNDARTTIFDYWSMPEFAKWVNGGKFDGGRLAPAQKSLREFYATLLHQVGEPAFVRGDFLPLNPYNIENPAYGRLPDETASGHWLYSFLRHDPVNGQIYLVVINLHPSAAFDNVRIQLSPDARLRFSAGDEPLRFQDQLGSEASFSATGSEILTSGIPVGRLAPLTPYYFQLSSQP